jgi:hypothetical protein
MAARTSPLAIADRRVRIAAVLNLLSSQTCPWRAAAFEATQRPDDWFPLSEQKGNATGQSRLRIGMEGLFDLFRCLQHGWLRHDRAPSGSGSSCSISLLSWCHQSAHYRPTEQQNHFCRPVHVWWSSSQAYIFLVMQLEHESIDQHLLQPPWRSSSGHWLEQHAQVLVHNPFGTVP